MHRISYNYSSVVKRESRIYNFGFGYIPGGVSVNFLKIIVPIFIFFLVIGYGLSLLLGISMFNPLSETFNVYYLLAWLALGGIASGILWGIEFAGFKLYEYLLAVMRPKKVINARTKKVRDLSNKKIDAIIIKRA